MKAVLNLADLQNVFFVEAAFNIFSTISYANPYP